MAYCLTLTGKRESWPETLVNEAERLKLISAELKKQVFTYSSLPVTFKFYLHILLKGNRDKPSVGGKVKMG